MTDNPEVQLRTKVPPLNLQKFPFHTQQSNAVKKGAVYSSQTSMPTPSSKTPREIAKPYQTKHEGSLTQRYGSPLVMPGFNPSSS